jgi:hypothetical protein
MKKPSFIVFTIVGFLVLFGIKLVSQVVIFSLPQVRMTGLKTALKALDLLFFLLVCGGFGGIET